VGKQYDLLKNHPVKTSARKTPQDIRSHRWFGESDMRGFGHHSRTAQMGYSREDYQGKPVIPIVNTWSDINACHSQFRQRADEVKRGALQAGGFPLEMPALALAEVFQKPTTMLYRNLLAMRRHGVGGLEAARLRRRGEHRHRHHDGAGARRLDERRRPHGRARAPLVANIRPAGKYLMEDFFYAGGLRALLRKIGDLLDPSARTANGRRAAWKKPAPRYERGFGALDQRHVTQADHGCDFDFLEGTAPTPEPELH